MKARGFTLVELVMVIMITGIIAGSIAVFFKPAIDSYFDTRRRADLADLADTAVRRMAQDIRRAVPNSINPLSATCFRLVPTSAGGRYRMASDTVNDTPAPLPCTPGTTCSAPLDPSQATTMFDVLSPLASVPIVGDWVVINNQNAGDVYAGTNRSQITDVATPRASDGVHRITIDSRQFSSGYDGGRFVVVADAEQTVTYTCSGGVLYRKVAAFGAADCAAGGATVATDVAGCTFVHDPNQGATQQGGFVWLRLDLSRAGESAALVHGVHVDNVP